MTSPAIESPIAFLPQESHGLGGRLGFAPAPGRWRYDPSTPSERLLDADLASLRAMGTSVLVTLLEEAEMARIGLAPLLERARRAGMEALWYPIPDGTAPSDLLSAARLVEAILGHLSAGRTVVVHCHGGIGRSGTIAACSLVAAGLPPGRAVEMVRVARAGAATAAGQEEFVEAFARAWAVTSRGG
jgi:protein-tyrosine phosphatase